jgi:stage II sporulation protein D
VHQTYRGVHTSEIIKRAVQETEGLIMTHKDEPILAMFDSCCGGIIPMHIAHGIDFMKAPYLARPYACHYCKDCKIYQWHAEWDINMFEKQVCNGKNAVKRLHNITVAKRDKAGLVLEVELTGHKMAKRIPGRKLYSLLHDVKSYCFDIVCREKKVSIKGYGFGHHIGLCQWGACEMVRCGRTYQQVLSFYYPGTRLVRLV